MKRFLMIGAVLGGFVLGLVFSNIPAAHADSSTGTWEYNCFYINNATGKKMNKTINKNASEGWELDILNNNPNVNFGSAYVCFKRPVQSGAILNSDSSEEEAK